MGKVIITLKFIKINCANYISYTKKINTTSMKQQTLEETFSKSNKKNKTKTQE